VPIEQAEVDKIVIQTFTGYVQHAKGGDEETEEEKTTQITKDFFAPITDLQRVNGKKGDDVFYAFLNKIFDKNEDEVETYLPSYLADVIKNGVIEPKLLAKGLTKFLIGLPFIIPAYPHMSALLSKAMYVLYK
jgi:hypothetical protein